MKRAKTRDEKMAAENKPKRRGSRSSDTPTKQDQKQTSDENKQKILSKIDESKQTVEAEDLKQKLTSKKSSESKTKMVKENAKDSFEVKHKNGDGIHNVDVRSKPKYLDEKLPRSEGKIEDPEQRYMVSNPDAQTSSKPKENLARKVINFEEEVAGSRDSLNDLKEFRATCNNIEVILKDVFELKKMEDPSDESKDELTHKKVDAMVLTTNLKKLNRLAQIREYKAKESTQKVKNKVDLLHLDLQNLLYEVMHMKREIQKCMNFSSKDEEIDLIDVDRFYSEAPEDISKPDLTKTDTHQQMMARLDFELKRRKDLAVQKTEYVDQKKKTETELKQKSDYLSNLKPRLDQIIKATMPVQEYMGLPIEAERLLYEKAQYLPRPLYVLYIQAKAFKDVCDKNMDVNIEGDLQIAKSEFDDDGVDSDISDDSETEGDCGAESDGTRGRKEKKDVKKVRLEVHQHRLLKTHPLTVHITIMAKDKYEVSLIVQHIPSLQINTVKIRLELDDQTLETSPLLSPDSVLRDLLSKDSGKDSPNTANKYQLDKLNMKDFSYYVSTLGLSYYWLQWICGVNYLPSEELKSYAPQTSLSVKHFQSVIKAIRLRLDARLSLQKQIQQFEQLIIPSVKKDGAEKYSSSTVSQLSSWKKMYFEDCLRFPSAQELVDCGLISEDCSFYSAKLTREETLKVGIVIHTNYPQQPPLLLLSIRDGTSVVKTQSDLMSLEREMNVYTEELLTSCDRHMLLSVMLKKIQVCFDMFVETGPKHITKQKLYTRKTRGRDRNRPYVHHPDGYYIQR